MSIEGVPEGVCEEKVACTKVVRGECSSCSLHLCGTHTVIHRLDGHKASLVGSFVCETCNGLGRTQRSWTTKDHSGLSWYDCPRCGGARWTETSETERRVAFAKAEEERKRSEDIKRQQLRGEVEEALRRDEELRQLKEKALAEEASRVGELKRVAESSASLTPGSSEKDVREFERTHQYGRPRSKGVGPWIPLVMVLGFTALLVGLIGVWGFISSKDRSEVWSAPAPTSRPSVTAKATATSVPTPAFIAGTTEVLEIEVLVHGLVNEYRIRNGLVALRADTALSNIARQHSTDMAQNGFFDHDNLRGQDPTDRSKAAGYNCRKNYGSYYTDGVGENLFQTWLFSSTTTTYIWGVIPAGSRKDYMTSEQIAKQIVDGWIESSGHRENILNTQYDRVGTGVAISSDEEVFVTQDFC